MAVTSPELYFKFSNNRQLGAIRTVLKKRFYRTYQGYKTGQNRTEEHHYDTLNNNFSEKPGKHEWMYWFSTHTAVVKHFEQELSRADMGMNGFQ